MRKVVSHTILTLDGVAVFDAVADTIAELRDTKEVLDDFFGKVADEDAVLLGRVTYQEWADYWPTSTNEPFASHINSVPKFVISRSLEAVPWGKHENATLVGGDLADAITDLNRNPERTSASTAAPRLSKAFCKRTCSTRCASRSTRCSRAKGHACSRTSVRRKNFASPIR